jgi:hypothetical protein
VVTRFGFGFAIYSFLVVVGIIMAGKLVMRCGAGSFWHG